MVPARLHWHREGARFVAYPSSRRHPERCAAIELRKNLPTDKQWFWVIAWPKWFQQSGQATDRQAAADAATEAWWAHMATPIPRDVETEIDVLVARVLVVPPPNYLFSEDSEFLRKLINALRLHFESQMRAGDTPPAVEDLLANLSEELYRRRVSGGGAA